MQKNKRQNLFKKFIANFLVVVFLSVSLPMSVFADEIEKITSVNEEIYKEEVINEDNVIEKTENKTTYELEDGLKREVIYDTNVRFYDEDNNDKLTDYDPSLIKVDSNKSDNNEDLSKYKYENKAGDKKVYLPEKISTETPILLENDKNQIKVTPIIENETSKVNVENEKTLNIYDDEVSLPIKANYEDINSNMVYEYISQDNGIKENLVLNENPKSNIFEYEITVDDTLIPKKCEIEESIVFNDKETDETKASIDVPFMNDKTGNAYSEDITYDIKKSKEDDNKYILTMTLSEDYLNDEDRVYPIEVDPTITWTGESNLIDTYILSDSKYADFNFYGSGTTAFPIGYTSSMGTCRSLIRSLDLLDTVKDKYVEKATLTMYETSSCDANMTVNAYRIIDGWSKATVTWNNKPRYSTSSGIMGTVKTTGTLYKSRVMDITTYARGLANGTYSTDKGLMLKTNSDTSSSAGYCKFYGSRHSSSSLRPKFTVDYYDAPTIASSVKLSKAYLKSGNTATLTWSGIESRSLDYVEYRIARRDDETGTIDTVANSIILYTQIGNTSSGSKEISTIKDLPEGCYRILVRGVDTSGVIGKATGYNFHIDNTSPTIENVTFNNENETPTITWENANDLHLKQIQYSLNNGTYKSMGSDISGNFIIPDEEFTQDGTYTIKVRAIDKSGNTSEVSSFNYERITDDTIIPYTPQNVNISTYYGKNLITWDMESAEELPGTISFNVYKGTTENFTPSEDNLIAGNIKTLYYADMEVGGTSYYKVKAIKTGTNTSSQTSSSIVGVNINTSEFDKRLGSKEYLGYFTFDTPNGNGTIEKSKGNLNYSQTDIDLPTEQLDYSLNRNYNSQSTFSGMFGLGFSDSFHKELYKVENDIVFSDSDGSIYKFEKSNNEWSCDETKDYELEENEETDNQNGINYNIKVKKEDLTHEEKTIQVKHFYQITTKDNTIYRFNEKGQLVVVTEPNETCLIYTYDNLGRLSKINNSNGIEVNLQYKEGNDKYLLDKIVLPDETVLSYDYSNGKLTKFKHSENDSLLCLNKVSYEFEYNTEGLLNIIKDAKGNPYSINYNSNKANKVTYPNGENYNITYNNLETSVNKKNENNNSIYTEKTNFDATTGKVIQEIDVDGNITNYSYDFAENPYLVTATTKIVDYQELNGSNVVINKTKEIKTTIDYTPDENIDKEVDEEGNITNYKYGENEANENQPISIKTTTTNEKTISNEKYLYDEKGNLTTEIDYVEDTITKNTYNDCGETTNETTTEYDNITLSVDEIAAKNGDNDVDTTISQSETICNYDKVENEYDVKTTVENINTESNLEKYDSMGRIIYSKDDTSNVSTKYTYDYLGRETNVETTTKIIDGVNQIETTTKEYDDNGTLTKETSNGVTTSYEYDNINRLTKKTISKGNETVSYNTVYGYEDNIKNLNVGTTVLSELDNVYFEKTYKNNDLLETKYYSNNGNLIREKSNNIYKDYVYDNNKNTIATFEMNATSDDDLNTVNKKISISLYDEKGNNTCTIENAKIVEGVFKGTTSSIINKSIYDNKGNIIQSIDGEEISTGYTYDDQSRVTSVISAKGSSIQNTTSIVYDITNEIDDIINQDETATIITNANDNKSYEIKNAAGLTVKTIDKGSNNIENNVDDIVTTYKYDSKGNKIKEIFSNGNYKTYSYTLNNMVKNIVYFEKSGEHILSTEYVYGTNGQVASMVDYKYDGNDKIPYHYTYYEYDENDRLIGYSEINKNALPSDADVENNKLKYTYDIEGNIKRITYPTSLNDIPYIEFRYNSYNWITSIQTNINGIDKVLRDYSYNNDGTINNIKDYTYTTTGAVSGYILKKYTYDIFGRVTNMNYYNSDDLNTVKESYRYTYDHNSNIKSETIKNNYPTNNSDKVYKMKEYTYDQMNRLTHSLIEDIDTGYPYMVYYSYDNVGNRMSMTDENEGTRTSYSYNGLNQLVSATETKLSNENEVVSNKTYTYDKNGNNISEIDSVKNITKEMTYDVDNRLDTYTQAEGEKVTTQSNLYNGNGQRIQKKEGDNTINYFYQGNSVLYTTNGDGDKTSHNFIGIEGNTISTIRYNLSGLEYYVYNKDIRGSTSNIVDSNKNAKLSYIYSDFGETKEIGDTTFYNEIAYTGGVYDSLSNLYYLNARYYNPEDARFITQDTYRGESSNPSSLHLYAYCTNNPINYIDPTGHMAFAIPIGIEISKAAIGYLLYIGGAIVVSGVAYISASKAKVERNKYNYFKVIKRNNDIYIGSGLSKSEAASRLRYADVWSKTQNGAKHIAKSSSPISKILGPEIDKNKGTTGKYYHYHIAKKTYNNEKDKGKKTRNINGRKYVMYKTHSFYGSKVY